MSVSVRSPVESGRGALPGAARCRAFAEGIVISVVIFVATVRIVSVWIEVDAGGDGCCYCEVNWSGGLAA